MTGRHEGKVDSLPVALAKMAPIAGILLVCLAVPALLIYALTLVRWATWWPVIGVAVGTVAMWVSLVIPRRSQFLWTAAIAVWQWIFLLILEGRPSSRPLHLLFYALFAVSFVIFAVAFLRWRRQRKQLSHVGGTHLGSGTMG